MLFPDFLRLSFICLTHLFQTEPFSCGDILKILLGSFSLKTRHWGKPFFVKGTISNVTIEFLQRSAASRTLRSHILLHTRHLLHNEDCF